jgi:LysM repeat protein
LAFLRTQAAAGTVTQVAAFASPTPIPCIPRSDWDIYVIDVGDTFYSIARRYNLSMEALAAANCIPNLSLIYAGQPLRVPPGGDRAVQGPDAGVEFCNTSDAVLTAPSPGTGLTGMVILRGVAQGTNFRRYILDWRPDDPAVDYQSFAEVFTAVTAEGELGQFNSDAFSPGLYWFRLRVLETNDFIIGQCAIRVRFR